MMKKRFVVGLIFASFLYPVAVSGVTQATKYTNIGNIALTVTNFGMIGNGFRVSINRQPLPSFEYPIHSKTEHLYRAGLWVGGITVNGDTLVTTGVVDATGASAGSEGFEFYPTEAIDDTIIERSTLLTSPAYTPNAVSEQDYIATYYDYLHPVIHHTPLGLKVIQRSYAWSYSYADDFVIISFTIINDRDDRTAIQGVYIGMYAELVTANREYWGDQFNTAAMFQHKRLFYDDTLHMVYEHNDGTDTLADFTTGGIKLLGVKLNGQPIQPDTVSFNWWAWQDMAGSVDDIMRYALMANGERDPDVDDEYVSIHGYPDPIPMISFGPIPSLNYGDSLTVVFAFVGGENTPHLYTNASWAQRAYDANYILPAPPPSPRLVCVPDSHRVILYWDSSPEHVPDPNTHQEDFEGYRIYRRTADDTNWVMIAQFDIADTLGFNTGLPDTVPPPRGFESDTFAWYKFEDVGVRDGFTYAYAITSYDRGNPELGLESLESSKRVNETQVVPGTPPAASPDVRVGVYPNPYKLKAVWDKDDVYGRMIRFYNLPKNCRIYIYNLAGDLVKTIEHHSDVIGEEPWNLITDKNQEIATGLYIFVVKDLDSGHIQRGRFLVIK